MHTTEQLNTTLSGRYDVLRLIGAGGMATVYLATDLRHNRRVALKVLNPELDAVLGAERFLSEIQVTANLQHPNLLPLFDSGEADGLLFYVMPFVEGESLRARLDRERQLPVDEAVRVAMAVASALDYAHRHGVIHRDLKPENILLHDGQPLVADFGIALAVSNAAGARITQTGLSLGTPQYMSPEQAAGDRAIDGRTDVYSLGAVLYEMLTGEPPHTGATMQAIIARVLTEKPRSVRVARPSAPDYTANAVDRALEKLPADRFATARAFADALTGLGAVVTPRQNAHSRSLRKWKLATAGLAVVSAAAIGWAMTHRGSAASSTQTLHFALGLPDSAALNVAPFDRSFDLSPDGTQFVYIGADGLFVRSLKALTPRRLTSEPGADPRFSPDGAWVAYNSNFTLRKVPVGGGAPTTIADSVARFGWSSTGTIVFTRSGPAVADLWRVSDKGGPAERFVHQLRPTDKAYGTPHFLPDGDAFLVPSVTSAGGRAEIAVYRLSDRKMRYLGLRGDHPLYLPGGVLLYVDPDEGVFATTFDARSLRLDDTRMPTRVFQGVMGKVSSAELAVSSTGTMVYLPGAVPRQLVEVDRTGRERSFPLRAGLFNAPRYSPDGRLVAVVVGQAPSTDVCIYDIASSILTNLTTNHRAGAPEWTPDGRRVAWTQAGGALGMRAAELATRGTFWRSVDGRDTAATLVPSALGMAFAPTGGFGVSVIVGPNGLGALNRVELDSTRRLTFIMATNGPSAARISPDGRWIAYVSTESDRSEVYVRLVSGTGGHYQVSAGGGGEPMWNPRGGELFYRTGSQLVAASLAFGAEPRVTRRDTLPFRIARSALAPWASYDVSRDGQRFLMVKAATPNDQPIVMVGWLDEVRELLKVPR